MFESGKVYRVVTKGGMTHIGEYVEYGKRPGRGRYYTFELLEPPMDDPAPSTRYIEEDSIGTTIRVFEDALAVQHEVGTKVDTDDE